MTTEAKKSLCPYSRKCGGCEWIDIPYPQQLKRKEETVRKLIGSYCRVNPVLAAEDPLHYRSKVHAVFGRGRGGNVISGIYKEGTHQIIPVDECLIDDETADRIIRTVRDLAVSFKLPVYDEDRRSGCIRHVLIRTAKSTGQVLVVLVTGSSVFPSRKNFVQALRVLHPEITTIIQNINGKKTSLILGDKESVLFGPGFIEDELCGLRFRISSQSFFQVNADQTRVLYSQVREAAHLTGKETVIDAYCGTGTIGMILAGQAKEVIGVEANPSAVRDAAANAARNKVGNIRFIKADAGEYMLKMASLKEKADVLVMDPPRSGASKPFLEAAGRLAPERIVYVSCDPTSLARDMKILIRKGYRAVYAQPVDMFPNTIHVETVCLLTHS